MPYPKGKPRTIESKRKISFTMKKKKLHGPVMRGHKNPAWKGKKVGYGALHIWVKFYKGKPMKCENCKKVVKSSFKIHWANKSKKYKRDLNDWIRLCVPCHWKYDHSML